MAQTDNIPLAILGIWFTIAVIAIAWPIKPNRSVKKRRLNSAKKKQPANSPATH